ncbi:unnamed protein product [Urochloa decumbens]|uniref:Uncharacterized protein n=1 Tax=Urochloa decumbens TaxID=240449 RepID=A0ABC9CBM7_9POAL
MEGVMMSAVTGAISSLLTKFATLLEKNYKLNKGVKKEITSLRDEMSSMNALLMDLSSMDELNEQQKEWRDKVRELSYDMEDCIDIFVNDRSSGKAWPFQKFMASNNIAKRIEELRERVVEASNSHNRYRDDLSISHPCNASVDPLVLALNKDTSTLVGTERARDRIIWWLLEEGGQQVQQLIRPCFEPWNFARFLQEWYYFLQNFCKTPVKFIPSKKTKVISIVGQGGVGKTALTHQVYTMVKSKFDCTAFVSASSQNPNTIFSDILSGVGCLEVSRSMDQLKLIDLLKEHLKDKRYLIVIDDVWTRKAWETIKCCFVENNRGSRVIITTRIEHVAQAWYPYFNSHVYSIKPLDDLDSRRLFYRDIFGSEDACPENLKSISDEILKKCGGLPLAIICVAGVLASHNEVNSLETWEKIKVYLGFQLETNPALESMKHVLNLSYNNLSLDLKTCMLYFAIFPEDSEIIKSDLVKRWIAEGFITEKHRSSPEEIAESYFNELINRNMIQVARMDDCGHVLSCRVHDVMLEFIVSKATEENFVTVINDLHSRRSRLQIRRLSLQVRDSSECSNHALGDMVLTQVRSFNFWGPAERMPSLSKFQLVRVVHLDVYDDSQSQGEQYDISSLCKFFQLRYLRIRGLGCRQLQLRKLQNLVTLELLTGKTEKLEIDANKLPPTLWHLLVPTKTKLIGAIYRLKALRSLGDLDIETKDVEKNIKGLGELGNLRELKLSLSDPSSETAHVVGDLLPSSLSRLSNLRSLVIRGSFTVAEDSLTRWHTLPRHLHRLHALVCPFSTVPTDWITHLDSLRSLEIKVVSLPRDGTEVLARLTSLVHLRLHVDKHAPEEGVLVHRAAFAHLKEFWFAYQVPCLMFEAGAMPMLQNLTVQCYTSAERQADGVLDGIEHLGSLKACRVDIANFAIELQAAFVLKEDVPRWNKQALQAAFSTAISKHPGSLDVRIQSVYIGIGPSDYYTF